VSKDETNDLALLQASTGFKEIAAMRATAMRPGEAVKRPCHRLIGTTGL